MATTLLVCAVYALGPAATILMPMIVGGLIDGYGYTEQQAGNIAALEGLGLVAASVLAAAWIRRLSWTRALLASFLGYAALNVVSAGVTAYFRSSPALTPGSVASESGFPASGVWRSISPTA